MNDIDLPFGIIIFILLSVIGSFALSITRNHRHKMRFQLRLFLWAFAVRFAASIIIYQFGLVQVLKDEDASGWALGAVLQRTWVQQGIGLLGLPSVLAGAFEGHHRGYYYMVGALFYIIDTPARMPAAVLNCFFGALTVIFAYRIASSLFSSWVAIRVGWLTCLFPSMLIWSAQTLKEPVVILLETLALYGCVRLRLSGFSLRHVLLCAAAIILMIPFRFYATYVAGAAVMLTLVLPHMSRRGLTIGSAIAVALLVISLLSLSGILVQNEAEFERFDLQRVQKFRRDIAAGTGSGIESGYDLNTPQGLVLGTVLGGAHLLLAPFPWQLGVGSVRMLLTTPELVVWWWLFFVAVLPGLWYAIRHRFGDVQPLLFFIFGLGLLYSLMFGNVGLAYRNRVQLLPWLLVFATIGLEQRALRRLAARRARMAKETVNGSRLVEVRS